MASQRQLEANRRNWQLWHGASPEGRARIAAACRRSRPWERSTGPKSEAGKLRSRANARGWGRRCRTLEPYASAAALCGALWAAVDRAAVLERRGINLRDDAAYRAADCALCDAIEQFTRIAGVHLTDDDLRDWPGFFGVVWVIEQRIKDRKGEWSSIACRLAIANVRAILRLEQARQLRQHPLCHQHARAKGHTPG